MEQPRNAHAVAHFQRFHAIGNFFHDADAFVSQHHARFIAIIACGNVQIGVAHATIFHFNQCFVVTQRADFFFCYFHAVFCIGVHYCCFHFSHDFSPFGKWFGKRR